MNAVGPSGRVARDGRCDSGVVLLEVVLSLVLFAATAAIITGVLNSGVDGVERQKLRIHAANLAVTVISELQMGLRSWDAAGPEPFPVPFEGWTWELAMQPVGGEIGESTGLTQVEVAVRHKDPPLVHRLAQVLTQGTASSQSMETGPDPGGEQMEP